MIRYAPILSLLFLGAAPHTPGVELLVPETFRGQLIVVTGLPCGEPSTYAGGQERIRVPANGIVILRDGLNFSDGHLGVVRDGAEVQPAPADPAAPPTPMELNGIVTREEGRYDRLTSLEISRMKHASFSFTNNVGESLGKLETLALYPRGKRLGEDGKEADMEALYGANSGFWFEGEGAERVCYTSYFIGEAHAVTVQLSPDRKAEVAAAVKACRGH